MIEPYQIVIMCFAFFSIGMITADEVRKTHKLLDIFVGPLGGKYSLWKKGNRIVGIHDDDGDIVSIFDLDKQQYVYIDKKTKDGLDIVKKEIGGKIGTECISFSAP